MNEAKTNRFENEEIKSKIKYW